MASKPSFSELLPVIQEEIEKRRYRWRLTTMDFDDVSQILIIHVFKKFSQFDPERGKFKHWLRTVLSSQTKNLLRDNLMKFNRPCIGCPFNMGGNTCGYTTSKEQDSECPVYAHWKQNEKKQNEYNVKTSLSLEHHANESQNMQSDFVDIGGAKAVIDSKIMETLNRREKRMYRLLYIKGKTPEQVGIILKYKSSESSPTYAGYQQIRKFQKRMVILAKQIIEDENLV